MNSLRDEIPVWEGGGVRVSSHSMREAVRLGSPTRSKIFTRFLNY